jgi:hypothetical protein
MVNMAFVAQSYTDICQKLQKLEGFTGMNATQLLEVANKVFVNREYREEREADARMKAKASLLPVTNTAVSSAMEGETQWENPTPTRPVCLLQEDWQLEE